MKDRVICFGKTDSRIRGGTKTEHPASVMMLGVVASTGEKNASNLVVCWITVTHRRLLDGIEGKCGPIDPQGRIQLKTVNSNL
uniref:Uncharacterized protein n=1 Tax=Lepeophtheirus salmonis TaxID=72036 RepID=A0A0K2TU67_LEPSM